LLSTAQAEYLRGHWFEAEAAIKEILSRNPRDVEARLLWVGVLRRSKRIDAARRQLKILSRLEGADRWALELRDERRRVSRLVKESANASENIETQTVPENATTDHLNRDDESGGPPATIPFPGTASAEQSAPLDAGGDASLSEAA
jgi:hypothetical protein